MPYADNNGVRIHYHVGGEGPPLVLHHGLAGDLETWRAFGYVDSLNTDYLLILMDARGHGASDKPHDPEAYAMEHRVGDVVTVLDDLTSAAPTSSATPWAEELAIDSRSLLLRRQGH